jgi:hypothetical protein
MMRQWHSKQQKLKQQSKPQQKQHDWRHSRLLNKEHKHDNHN